MFCFRFEKAGRPHWNIISHICWRLSSMLQCLVVLQKSGRFTRRTCGVRLRNIADWHIPQTSSSELQYDWGPQTHQCSSCKTLSGTSWRDKGALGWEILRSIDWVSTAFFYLFICVCKIYWKRALKELLLSHRMMRAEYRFASSLPKNKHRSWCTWYLAIRSAKHSSSAVAPHAFDFQNLPKLDSFKEMLHGKYLYHYKIYTLTPGELFQDRIY